MPWVKRNPYEAPPPKKFSITQRLLQGGAIFAMVMGALVVSYRTGGTKTPSRVPHTHTWDEVLNAMPAFLIIAGGLSLIGFYFNFTGEGQASKLCRKCERGIEFRHKLCPECGGELVLLADYRWVDKVDRD